MLRNGEGRFPTVSFSLPYRRRALTPADPRNCSPSVKWVTSLVLAVTFVSLSSRVALAAGIVLTLFLAMTVAGVRPSAVATRLALALPFAAVSLALLPLAGPGGAARAFTIALRLVGATLSMAVLTLSTPLALLFDGAARLGLPRPLIEITHLALRYLEVLRREAARLLRARRARGFSPEAVWRKRAVAAFGELLGALFLRSLDRSERVHRAIAARTVSRDRRLAALTRQGVPSDGAAPPTPTAASAVAGVLWALLFLAPAVLMVALQSGVSAP